MIKFIKSYFEHKDDRGGIYGISNNFVLEELNIIESKKETIRGNHYHKKSTELFFIIKGEVEVIIQKIDKKGNFIGPKSRHIVKKNDIFIIEPYLIHTFRIIKDSKWLNAMSKKHDQNKPDFYKINLNQNFYNLS